MTSRRRLKRQLHKALREIAEETISVGSEVWSRDDLLDAISDYSKELTGRRDRGAIQRLASAPLEDLVAHYDDMFRSEEAQQMAQDLDTPAEPKRDSHPLDSHEERMHPLENAPKRQGMGRRSENRMRITKDDLRRRIRRALNESMQEYGVNYRSDYDNMLAESRTRGHMIYLCEGPTGLGSGVTTFGTVMEKFDRGEIDGDQMWNIIETSMEYEWARIWGDPLLTEGLFGNLGAKADKFLAKSAEMVKGAAGGAAKVAGAAAGAVKGVGDVAKGAAKGAWEAMPDSVKKGIEMVLDKAVSFFEKMFDKAIAMAEKHTPTFVKIVRKMIEWNASFKEKHPILHSVISKIVFMLIIYGITMLLTPAATGAVAAKGAGAGGAKAAAAAKGAAGAAKVKGAAAATKGAAAAGKAKAAAGAAKGAAAAGKAKAAAGAAKTAKAAKAAGGAAKAAKAAKVAKGAASAAKGAKAATVSSKKIKAMKGLLDTFSQSNPEMAGDALEAIKMLQDAQSGGVTTAEIANMNKAAKAALSSVNKIVATAKSSGDPTTIKYLMKLTKLGGRVVVKG